MKNIIKISTMVTVSLLVWQCQDKEHTNHPNLSPCLSAKIDSFKLEKNAVAVEKYILDDKALYWFVTNARTFDGQEYVYDESCNLACTIGGFRLAPQCAVSIQNMTEKKVIIWKK